MPPEDRYSRPLDYESGRLVRQIDEPITVGNILWVFTDPHRGYEFAYNRWYERDHYYAGCMIGPADFAGSRWVATRNHKQARFPEQPDWPFDRADGSYACVYYVLGGAFDEWSPWAGAQVRRLYAADRGFAHRTHYNTALYDYEWRAYRDPDPVPLELALDRRYGGLIAQFVEPAEHADHAAVDAWFDRTLPGWLAGSKVACVSSWSLHQSEVSPEEVANSPVPIPGDPKAAARRLQLYFVEGDPLETWEHQRQLGAELDASGQGTVVLSLPFIPTVVGTDAYIDELWY
jgi:hypothetical protein